MLLLSLLSMDWAITGVIMIVVFYLTSVYLRDRRLRSFLPPGPVAWPLVGNLPQIIGQDLHIALTNLADIFGNLVWMKMGSENVLVVNSMDAAVASLVRQGKVFSGRPRKRKTVEVLLGEGKDIVMNDVLPELKIHRRIVHSFLSSQTHSDKDRLKHIILNESRSLEDKMKTFSSESVSFDPKFQVARVVANVLCQCILSRRFDDVDEQFHEQLRIVQDIVDNIESFNIVDVIPWLEHFPIPSWRRFLTSLEKKDIWINRIIREHRETRTEEKDRDLVDIMLKIQKEALESGNEEEIRLLSDQNIGHIVHELFGGGIESTTMTILWFILYLIHNPQWQEKIYEEIHENSEEDELPNPFERANYPLLEATVKETLRMACILPVGFPHRTLRDTELNGYYIPADTMVLMNIWAIHHDKNAWKDPDTFNPERFLYKDSGERYSYLPFGIGHRVCLGSNIAKMSVFSFCATLIKNYKITVPDGSPLPDMKPNAGLTNRPKPFEIKLVKRC